MDTLTHSLVGTAVSDGFFRKRLGPLATPFALVVSALPDADAVTYLVAPEYAWAYHRGVTHSLFYMFLAAPVLGLLVWLLDRRRSSWKLWSLLALICLWGHTAIDLTTSWGTMPLLPFSNARISWDVAPILDAFTFSVTAASFVANRLLRWERVETFLNPLAFPVVHEHPRRRRVADWMAAICSCLVVCYLLIGWQQNRQTVRIATNELKEAGVDAVEVRALPLMFSYIAWGIAARDADGNVYNTVYSSYAPTPMRFDLRRTAKGPEVDLALETREGRLFRWYSQNMFVAENLPDGDGCKIVLHDRRFFTLSRSLGSRFTVEVCERADGGIVSVAQRQRGFDGVDIRRELDFLWRLTWDGVPPEPAP